VVNRFATQLPATVDAGSARVSGIPVSFGLKGARPNPFNPSTQIAYDVPQQTRVRLTIYNVRGQEVVTLVNEVKTAGRYTVVWNGHNTAGHGVASGVYLSRLTAGDFTETKRMTLLK